MPSLQGRGKLWGKAVPLTARCPFQALQQVAARATIAIKTTAFVPFNSLPLIWCSDQIQHTRSRRCWRKKPKHRREMFWQLYRLPPTDIGSYGAAFVPMLNSKSSFFENRVACIVKVAWVELFKDPRGLQLGISKALKGKPCTVCFHRFRRWLFLAASISRNPKLLHSRLGVWDKKQCYFTAAWCPMPAGAQFCTLPVAATRGEHSGPGGHRSLLEAISFASLFTSLAVKRVAELPRPWLSPRIPTVPASKNNSQPVSLLNIGDVRLQKGQWTGASYSLQAAGIFISSDLET